MKIDGYGVEPLTTDRWADLETVLGPSGHGGCWCTWWIHPTTVVWGKDARGGSKAANKRLFQQIVDQGPSPGLIAYDEGAPAGWCRVMPRASQPGLSNTRFFKTDLGIEGVWSIPCFVVRYRYRGRGLTAVLTKAAMRYARSQGARFVEAYPWDTEDRKDARTIITGMASTFYRLGFDVVQRKAAHRPMMRLDLAT